MCKRGQTPGWGRDFFFFAAGLEKDDGGGNLGVVWNELYFLYKIKLRNQKFL